MARVITFSKTFPSYHKSKGQPTNFVDKIWSGLLQIDYELFSDYLHPDGRPYELNNADYYKKFNPKFHTIRAGKRWKEGDLFAPRVWTGKPYNSKQWQFAPNMPLAKVHDFDIDGFKFYVNGKLFYHQHVSEWHEHMETLCLNDGLSFGELLDWFKVGHGHPPNVKFSGQILCWKDIKY